MFQQGINELNDILKIKKANDTYFVLCKKTYLKPNGGDRELLKAGHWYALKMLLHGIFVSDWTNKYYLYPMNGSAVQLMSEHFLFKEKEQIWIRLEIDSEEFIEFDLALDEEFFGQTQNKLPLILDNVDRRENRIYRIMYAQIDVDDVIKVTNAFEKIYQRESPRIKSQLYELDVDVADTQFYHER